jgi:DoxX-like protein
VPRAPASSKRIVIGFAGSLVLSALYDAIPNHWFEAEFEHLRLPRWFRPLFVLAKTSAATGLLVGRRSSRLGRLAARALVAYFVLAIGAHVRVKDDPLRYVPAVAMLAWSALAARTFPTAPPSST